MAIEKRIKYQDGGNGAAGHDPLEMIVFLIGKRQMGTITPGESDVLDKLIDETGFMSQRKAKGGKIEKPLPKPTYLNGNVIDLHDDSARKIPRFRRKIPEVDINKYENYEVASGRTREGIESLNVFSKLASAKDDFNFYYKILSKYYVPSDLHGKSLEQLDRMLQMFVRQDESVI